MLSDLLTVSFQAATFLGFRLADRGELPEDIVLFCLWAFSAFCCVYALWAVLKILYRLLRALGRLFS